MSIQNLNLLDQERVASMADEGGVSGALMESQDELYLVQTTKLSPKEGRLIAPLFRGKLSGITRPWTFYALALGLAVGVVLVKKSKR